MTMMPLISAKEPAAGHTGSPSMSARQGCWEFETGCGPGSPRGLAARGPRSAPGFELPTTLTGAHRRTAGVARSRFLGADQWHHCHQARPYAAAFRKLTGLRSACKKPLLGIHGPQVLLIITDIT